MCSRLREVAKLTGISTFEDQHCTSTSNQFDNSTEIPKSWQLQWFLSKPYSFLSKNRKLFCSGNFQKQHKFSSCNIVLTGLYWGPLITSWLWLFGNLGLSRPTGSSKFVLKITESAWSTRINLILEWTSIWKFEGTQNSAKKQEFQAFTSLYKLDKLLSLGLFIHFEFFIKIKLSVMTTEKKSMP